MIFDRMLAFPEPATPPPGNTLYKFESHRTRHYLSESFGFGNVTVDEH